MATVAFYGIKYRTLAPLGLRRITGGAAKRLYFFAPPVLAAALHFTRGIAADSGAAAICASLFLALGIGFCEEIYFRGILFGLWLETGEKTAAAVSTALFALCHLMNLAGGAGLVETVFQICFASVYGLVFALIFVACRSVWPCVILHALHDFTSLISAGESGPGAVAAGAVQFAVLLCYARAILKKRRGAAGR